MLKRFFLISNTVFYLKAKNSLIYQNQVSVKNAKTKKSSFKVNKQTAFSWKTI